MYRFRRVFTHLLFVSISLLTVCLVASKPVPPHPYFADGQFQVIAHRGGRGLMPENTLSAFRHADSLGVDVLEMDIHASADGQLVVIHDRTVDRTTDGHGRVDSMTANQLHALDAGYRWESDRGDFPYRGKGVSIPLLEEVLSEFSHRRMLIEIKPNSAQVAKQLCTTLGHFEMDEKTIVASFHGDALEAFVQACPQTPVSATAEQVLLYTLLHQLRLDTAYLNPPIAFQVPERAGPLLLVDERFITSVHARDAYVHVWTVNRTEAMRRLLDLGVDGIMTDYPDRLIALINTPQSESNP